MSDGYRTFDKPPDEETALIADESEQAAEQLRQQGHPRARVVAIAYGLERSPNAVIAVSEATDPEEVGLILAGFAEAIIESLEGDG